MAGGSGTGWPLVGRAGELALLDEEVGGLSGRVVLIGPMGVGKSRLAATWVATRETAGEAPVVVRATRSTATIPFGAFAGWVPAQLGGGSDRLAVLQATAARLVTAGAGVLVVDDAHLLDEGSAALVLHLVEHTSLGVLLTVRDGDPCPDAVVALWKEGLARRVDLAPLSEDQSADLLERALGDPLAPAAHRRVWQLTDGNPLYLREVVEAACAQGVLTRSNDRWRETPVWQWRGRLRGRTRLVELVSDRIGSRSDPAERQVMEAIALGEPLPVDVLARLAPRPLLAGLESRGLVVVEQASNRPTGQLARLAHPLYSEVLRAELPAFTARERSATLAAAALAAGLDRPDPVRVATWLLDGCDEPAQPDLLLRASLRARVVDEYALSLRFAEAAERAGAGWRATLRRAMALGPLGRLDEADALLATLSEPGGDHGARIAAAQVRAEQSFWNRGQDLPVALGIIAEAVDGVPGPARSSLLSYGAQLALAALDLDEAIRLATWAYNDAGSLVDRLHAVTTAGLAAATMGRTATALASGRLARAGSLEVLAEDPVPSLYVANTYSLASVLDGSAGQAAAVYSRMVDQEFGTDRGSSPALLRYWAGWAALEQGRVAVAVDVCRQALAVYGDENHYNRGAWIAAQLALAAGQAGDPTTAGDALAWVEARTRARVEYDECQLGLARAWLSAARGELSAARRQAVGSARRAASHRAWGLEAIACLHAARLGAPVAVAARLAELTAVVEGPYVAAAARFARAAADQDGSGLDAASELFAAIGAHLHAAEAAAAAAAVHATEGQRRRHAASRAAAQQHAARCVGADTPLLAHLDREPLVVALTEREHEVAQLAARGRTSREIAAALAISVRTVHSHLNHAYTKLGIGDRAELAAALGLDGNTRANGPTQAGRVGGASTAGGPVPRR